MAYGSQIIFTETLSVAVTITFLAIKNKKFGYWGKFYKSFLIQFNY